MTPEQRARRNLEAHLNALGVVARPKPVDLEEGGTRPDFKFRTPNFDENGEPDF